METLKNLNYEDVTTIIVHHTASQFYGVDKYYDIVRHQHVDINKWSDIGYHALIDIDGNIRLCRNPRFVGAHCYGHNKHSFGVAFVGNYNYCSPHTDAIYALRDLVFYFEKVCGHKLFINLHRDYRNTLCPGKCVVDFLLANNTMFKTNTFHRFQFREYHFFVKL